MASSRSSAPGQPLENENVNAEQMATLGEGEVADAVKGNRRKPQDGAGHETKIDDYASDLDRKKAEQASAREKIQAQRKAGVDVDGGPDRRAGVDVD